MTHPGDLVEFPETMVRQWLPYERMLREWLNSSPGHTPEMIEAMLGRLRPIYLKRARLARDHPTVQPGVGTPFDQVQHFVAAVTFGLLQEIARREAAPERSTQFVHADGAGPRD